MDNSVVGSVELHYTPPGSAHSAHSALLTPLQRIPAKADLEVIFYSLAVNHLLLLENALEKALFYTVSSNSFSKYN